MARTIIRCVMFDLGHVMADIKTGLFLDFIRSHCGNKINPQELFTGSLNYILKDYDLGKYRDFEFFEKLQSVFQADMNYLDFLDTMAQVVRPDYKMLTIKNDLKARGIKLVLITNINGFHIRYLERVFPEFVKDGYDYCMISCREKVIKPDPEAWLKPLEALGLVGEECLFVDDILVNIQAAKKLNINGWYFRTSDPSFRSLGNRTREIKKLEKYLKRLDSQGLLFDIHSEVEKENPRNF